jgi:hypothetical protein
MRIKGALHVHSTLSHDGTLSIAELAEWYARRGYHFVALSEHSEDLDVERIETLRRESTDHSSRLFLVIPGIEFSCAGGIHIPSLGVITLIQEQDPVVVIRKVHQLNGYAILAHPRRIRWKCPPEVLLEVNAVEIWNVGYDGKYVPSHQAFDAFRRMQQTNPTILAVVGQDFHRREGFYDAWIEMETPELSAQEILLNLHRGEFEIRSRLFRTDSRARLSRAKETSLRLLSLQLSRLRRARSLLLRHST